MIAIYPTEAMLEARRQFVSEARTGSPDKLQQFRRLLEIDPSDRQSLLALGHATEEAGRTEEAIAFYRRYCEQYPHDPAGYISLATAETSQSGNKALELGLMNLGTELLHAFRRNRKTDPNGLSTRVKLSSYTEASKAFQTVRAAEPAEVTERLRVYRLIQQVLLAPERDGIPSLLVDTIIERGPACEPFLLGILRGFSLEELPGESLAVQASLALLGEIGSPETASALAQFLIVNDDNATAAAEWALIRLGRRRTSEVLAVLREFIPHTTPTERTGIASMIPHFAPGVDGQDVILDLLRGVEAMDELDREAMFGCTVYSLLRTQLPRGRELAESVVREHAAEIPPAALPDCRDMLARVPVLIPFDLESATVHEICHGIETTSETEGDEDDLPPDLSPDLPLLHPKPERNDPCWCGSGKKYKKCHLREDEEKESPVAPRVPMPDDASNRLRRKLGESAEKGLSETEFRRVATAFYGEDGIAADSDGSILFDWLIFDRQASPAQPTLAQTYANRFSATLPPDQGALLQAWIPAVCSLYETLKIEPGSGVRLRDLLRGGEVFVRDISMSRSLVQWDCFFVRVLDCNGHFELSSDALSVARPLVNPLLGWLNDSRTTSGLSWNEFLRRRSADVRREVFRLYRQQRNNLKILTNEGDAVMFAKARFAIFDQAKLRAALESARHLSLNQDGSYTWLDGDRSLGTLAIVKSTLTLECISPERLDRGKAMLETLAGGAVSLLGDELQSVESALASAPKHPPKPSGIPPEIEKKLVGEFYAKHYANWPDQPLPALGGNTPRQSARSAKGREALEGLLRQMENGEERKRHDGLAWYDFARIRKELGM